MLADQQRRDAIELIHSHDEWAGEAAVEAYRCEIDESHHVAFTEIGRPD
jgi:hypothetical protein